MRQDYLTEREELKEIRKLFIRVLRQALASESAPTASMMSVIGKFLMDNDVLPEEPNPLDEMKLPTFNDEYGFPVEEDNLKKEGGKKFDEV